MGLGNIMPSIRVKPPGSKSKQMAEELLKYEAPCSSSIVSGKIPVIWAEAQNANITDVDGNIYIDFTSGFCVAGVGHGNVKVVEAIQRQAGKLLHAQGISNPSPPRVELVKKLAEIAPKGLQRSILVNTGAEAVELALKTAKIFTHHSGAICFHGSFHGKTYGALSLTSRNHYREPFLPLLSGITHIPYPYCYRCVFGREYPDCNFQCVRYLEYILDDPSSAVSGVAAIVLEPIQGHDGWIVPPPGFLKEIRRICSQRNLMMIVDEIITGFGRTGKWFAVDHEEVVPDILVLGKGMAGGFPISAVISSDVIMGAWQPAMHSSTFLGNPVGCAASLANIAQIEEKNLIERSTELGRHMQEAFSQMMNEYTLIGEVRGKGMMVGIELVKDRTTKEPATDETEKVVTLAREMGVIVNQGGKFDNVLKMTPPFTITRELLDEGIRIIGKSISKVQ